MLNDLWHLLQRTMSKSQDVLGVEEPLLTLEERLFPLELVLELESLWPPVEGLLWPDWVCSCMKESWLILTETGEILRM